MGQSSENNDGDEFMNASAEDWSKPEEPTPMPVQKPDETNRWGATLPEDPASAAPNRWGSEPIIEASTPEKERPAKQSKSTWWVILIVIVVVICLCICLVLFGLPLLGLNLIQNNIL